MLNDPYATVARDLDQAVALVEDRLDILANADRQALIAGLVVAFGLCAP